MRQEILQYLSTRPEASDDSEGITRFWVVKQRTEVAAATVERALNLLVMEGFLRKNIRRDPSGEVIGGIEDNGLILVHM